MSEKPVTAKPVNAKPVNARQRIAENPFYVLGLAASATRQEVEREGHKLLGMLELGLAAAAEYTSSLGPHPRTAELIRAAMADLRDPQRRLVAELWARLPAAAVSSPRTASSASAGATRSASPDGTRSATPDATPSATPDGSPSATPDAASAASPHSLAPFPAAPFLFGWGRVAPRHRHRGRR